MELKCCAGMIRACGWWEGSTFSLLCQRGLHLLSTSYWGQGDKSGWNLCVNRIDRGHLDFSGYPSSGGFGSQTGDLCLSELLVAVHSAWKVPCKNSRMHPGNCCYGTIISTRKLDNSCAMVLCTGLGWTGCFQLLESCLPRLRCLCYLPCKGLCAVGSCRF